PLRALPVEPLYTRTLFPPPGPVPVTTSASPSPVTSATPTRAPPVNELGYGLNVNLRASVRASYTLTWAVTPASVPTAKIGLVVVCRATGPAAFGAGPSSLGASFGGVTNVSAGRPEPGVTGADDSVDAPAAPDDRAPDTAGGAVGSLTDNPAPSPFAAE